MLDALVRQLPGATLSTDGVIEVNGRKINELLVNGKDFFKGDPKVALQNLPAYTVKNLQVYDKADKDAYLTHSNARLDRKEEEENLVMDVVLKKNTTPAIGQCGRRLRHPAPLHGARIRIWDIPTSSA